MMFHENMFGQLNVQRIKIAIISMGVLHFTNVTFVLIDTPFCLAVVLDCNIVTFSATKLP